MQKTQERAPVPPPSPGDTTFIPGGTRAHAPQIAIQRGGTQHVTLQVHSQEMWLLVWTPVL